jgi:hypothetical protein
MEESQKLIRHLQDVVIAEGTPIHISTIRSNLQIMAQGDYCLTSYNLLEKILNIVVSGEDEVLKEQALAWIPRFTARISDICKFWATTRNPDLERVITQNKWHITNNPTWLQVLLDLKFFGNVDNLVSMYIQSYYQTTYHYKLLIEALEDKDIIVAERASQILKLVNDPKALETLSKLWTEKRSAVLLDILTEKEYVSKKFYEPAIIVSIRLKKLDGIRESKAFIVKPLIQACQFPEAEVARTAKKLLGELTKKDAQQAVCRAVIEQDLPFVTAAALKAGYLPNTAPEKALFYFVTEQWDKYEGLDFDHRLLKTAYATAADQVRQRIAAKIRASGRVEYLPILTGGDNRPRELNFEEAKVLVEILAANQQWEKLWKVIFDVPLYWSVNGLKLLVKAKWLPAQEDERTVFEQLQTLAQMKIITDANAATEKLPPAVLRAKVKVPGRVNDVAFSPGSPVIAIGARKGGGRFQSLHRPR